MRIISSTISLLILSAGAASAATATPVNIGGERAFALIETLERFYSPRVTIENQYSTAVAVDAVRCELTGQNTLPTCSVTVDGRTNQAPALIGLSPSSSLFQLISELGGAHADASRPGTIVAAATAVNCNFEGHSGPDAGCSLIPASGTPLPKQPATVTVTGGLADKAMSALSATGVPNTADHSRQYTDTRHADQVQCTAALREYASDSEVSCTVDAGGKALTVSNNEAITLYRLIAEVGGANSVQSSNANAYVATASNVDCVNSNTHEGTPSVCTLTLVDRHPVITRLSGQFFDASLLSQLYTGLVGLKAPGISTGTDGAVFLTIDSAECVNSSLDSSNLSAMKCSLQAGGKALVDSTGGLATTNTIGPITSTSAFRLDPVALKGQVLSTREISCYVDHGNPENCQADADVAFPLGTMIYPRK